MYPSIRLDTKGILHSSDGINDGSRAYINASKAFQAEFIPLRDNILCTGVAFGQTL